MFEKLSAQTKSAFTRQFNKTHSDPVLKKITGGKKGSKAAAVSKDTDAEEEEDEIESGELLGEEELMERKKAKQ